MAAPSSGLAQDWEASWQKGVAPASAWDIGGSYKPLARLLREGGVPGGRALVPGCGRGWDVAALASPDRYVVGLDSSPTAAAIASELLASGGHSAQAHVECADFFSFSGAFHVVFDYTMLCAMLPSRRTEWARQMRSLLVPGGLLLCGEFPLQPWPRGSEEDLTRGPPFQLSSALYRELLEAQGFECVAQSAVPAEESFPLRAGYEAFSVWRRAP